MQITRLALLLLPLLRGFGLNRHVRGWNRALARLFPHHRQVSRHFAVRRWGVTYLANTSNYIDWNVLCYGDYEREDLKLFRRFGRGGTCLDIGANVGHHSIFFASLGWTVHAFEPNPQLWSEFESKVAASGLSSITLHKIGLGSEDTTLQFELENATNSGTGRFTVGHLESPAGSLGVGRLPLRNGDRYLAEIGIDRVKVVKIDVQGFEPDALFGLRETLRRDRPLVSIEIAQDNTAKFDSFERFKQLLPEDYSFLRTRPWHLGPIRGTVIERYSGEAFSALNANLFCIPDR